MLGPYLFLWNGAIVIDLGNLLFDCFDLTGDRDVCHCQKRSIFLIKMQIMILKILKMNEKWFQVKEFRNKKDAIGVLDHSTKLKTGGIIKVA